MGSTSFAVLYKYKSELTRKARNIKIIVEKVRMLVAEFQKLHIELIINIRFILERAAIY